MREIDTGPSGSTSGSHKCLGEVHRRERVTAASQRQAEMQNLMEPTNARKLQISREIKVFFRGAEGDEP